jgi:hypothetical protein
MRDGSSGNRPGRNGNEDASSSRKPSISLLSQSGYGHIMHDDNDDEDGDEEDGDADDDNDSDDADDDDDEADAR